MEDNVQNEYLVTDENGCATDTSIFGNWEYNPDTNSLLASFNAFKFPSSDNIRFQCNIRVCFGRCQPVNCGGYNAFGRRRRSIADNSTDSTAIATNSGVEGQLREEITISSNAILTFEKRSGPGLNDANSEFQLSIDLNRSLIYKSYFCSQTGGSACRGHLRLDGGSDHRPGHHGSAGSCSRGRGCVLLANGLPQTPQDHRSVAPSAGVPQSAVRQSGRGARAHPGLPILNVT